MRPTKCVGIILPRGRPIIWPGLGLTKLAIGEDTVPPALVGATWAKDAVAAQDS